MAAGTQHGTAEWLALLYSRGMSDQITPAGLSRELGIPQKTIRDYLRAKYGTLPEFVSRWRLTEEQADDVKRNLS